jgi:hypothetical protein
LAEEFIRFYELAPLYGLVSIEQLARSLGIQVSDATLPNEVAGCHFRLGQQRKIFLSNNGAYLLSREQTLLHELREIIEYEFRDLGRPIFTQTDQETRAERFASSVREASVWAFCRSVADDASSIESKWDIVWTVIAAVAGLLYSFSLSTLPAYENDQLKRQNQEARMPSRQLNPATS